MIGDSSHSPTQKVLDSLRDAYKRKVLADMRRGVLLFFVAVILVISASAVLELVFDFGIVGRTVLFVAVLALFIYYFAKYLWKDIVRLARGASLDDIASIALDAGDNLPDFRDRLRNAVELLSNSSDTMYSKELAEEYISSTFEHAANSPIASSLRYRVDKRTKLYLAGTFAVALILFAFLPSQFPSSIVRIANFTHEYQNPEAYSISVSPGDCQLSRGDSLNVRVKISLLTAIRFPSSITMNERYQGEDEFEKHQVRRESGEMYHYVIPNVRSNVEYFVSVGDQNSKVYRVRVVDLPIVESFSVRLVYPAYTHKESETLEEDIGDFTALVGTKAYYTLNANKHLKQAWIDFSTQPSSPDTLRKQLTVNGSSASGSFTVSRSSTYTLQLLDSDSLRNRNPIVYGIQAVPDQYPTCQITYPGRDVNLNRDMQLPLKIVIGDDYGFTRLLLQYRLISSKYVPSQKEYRSIEIPLPSEAAGQEDISYDWDLSPLNLVPEDVISYHARVFDNDMVNGPKSAASAEYTLRLPSLSEAFAQADSEHSNLVSKTEEALKLSDNLNQEVQKISEDMKTLNKRLDWEQKKKMEGTIQKFDSLQRKIEDVKKQAESMTEKMLENKLLSPQTLEKYLELQKAIQQINSPEFQEALQKLQKAVSSLDPNQVRQAMQNFKMNEEVLRKSIERTLALIKRVEIEQKLDELQKRTAQMLDQQDSLRKTTAASDSSATNSRQGLSDQQREIQKELSGAQKEMSNLKDMMGQFPQEMPLSKLNEANQSLQNNQVAQKMQESRQQLSKGDFSNSMRSQEQISSALQNFQQQLSETQKEMLRNQERETVNALRKAQQNLLQISKEQETLRNRSMQPMEPNSPGARSLASQQYELMQQLNYTSQQMMQLSDKSFMVTPQMGRQIGQAYSEMNHALQNLQNRYGQTNSATGPQKQAMGSMNQAVMNIQGTLQSMMQGKGSAGSFPSLLQQLQQLAGQQQGLNSMTRQLGEQGEMTMQQKAELSRLAAQQELIRKSLEQLNQEFQQSQSKGQVLGDLNAISSEMKKVEKDMSSKNITQQTIQRQNRILTRMLDASRSINQQNYDNRRLAKAGKDINQNSPSELNLSNANSEREQQLLRLIRQNFPPEYQKVIIRYYQILRKSPD